MALVLIRNGGQWVPLSNSASAATAFPDATNTGVPSGVVLQQIPGDVTAGTGWAWDANNELVNITGANTNFSGYQLQDGAIIQVKANGVTVQNCKVKSSGTGNFGIALQHVSNVLIKNCEISGTRASGGLDSNSGNDRLQFGIKDVYADGSGNTIQGCNIYDTANSIAVVSGRVIGNYVHHMGFVDSDHIDCFLGDAAEGLVISGNTFLNSESQTACVALYAQQGPPSNIQVTDNLMAGGGYCIYGGNDPNDGTNIVITGNKISTQFYANGGNFGYLAHFGDTNTGNQWSGNEWYDGPNAGMELPVQ